MNLGYGTAALGRSLSRRERIRLVEIAYEAGVRWFDTAPLYGAGAAEDALGIALRSKQDAIVATKVGIVPPGLLGIALRRGATSGRFDPAEIRRQLDGSLRRLRRDEVEVVLLHEVDAASASLALDALEADGRARRTGIATGSEQTEAILATLIPDVVQLRYDAPVDPRGAQLVLHSVLAGTTGDAARRLQAASSDHPGAVVLVGSRSREHIREAAAALG